MLEGRHVIGLFMLMLLFSGVFFTLGYVMGRNQNDGQVIASTSLHGPLTRDVQPKNESAAKNSSKKPAAEPQETAAPSNGDWEFYHAGDSNKTDDKLKPAVSPTPAPVPTVARSSASTKQVNAAARANAGPPVSAGWNLQVAALTREADAMTLANTLRRWNFPTFVQPPQGDRYYHVLVGPYADQKALDNARKGLEAAGFKKAIVKH
ncbi:MAG TPA: SPOR domain-containing protein [Candidatus Methylomirabilis sp.]|nr:SPOR domain-containing protein [Candidatus Methylomirabilis sp.]